MLRILTLTVVVSVAPLALGVAPAHADYEDEQNNDKLGVMERAFDAFVKKPEIYDGTAFQPGVTANTAILHTNLCFRGPQSFEAGIKAVTPKGRGSAKARTLYDRYNEMMTYCKAMHTAAAPLRDGAATAELAGKAAAKEAEADQAICLKLPSEAGNAIGSHNNLLRFMDTWAGNLTLIAAEDIKTFRDHLEKLGPVCAQPKYANIEKCRRGNYSTVRGAGGADYSRADICIAAADPKKTLTAVAQRTIEHQIDKRTKMPTVESFRADEGWIQVEGEVRYATHFQVSAAAKTERTAKATEMYAAAGIPVPADLSMLWANDQARLDALKAAVDATAAEWKLDGDKCQGYACKMAENAVKKSAKAKVKRVTGSSWKVVADPGKHVYRYMGMYVIYQVPGEPFCQARSATANEMYQGGGKYQKASNLQWGYVRFQKCQ